MLIQPRTIEESVHAKVFFTGMLKASLTVVRSLHKRVAPQSSKLGIVVTASGATLVLAATKATKVEVLWYMALK